MTEKPQADAQAQVAAIREQHRKWMYYTERLTEALRDEGSASELYGYYLAMKDAHEPTTQRHIGALLRALDAAEARATRAEAERNDLLVLASDMCRALDLEGIGDEYCANLAILRGAFDIAASAQPVDEPTDAQVSDAIDARHAHELGYDAPGYDEDEG